ncbi:hypothetical protein RB195_019103 [Necator americanus]|uniref:Uncharacterized protein n=1 Tax=Necator americanus TaxID=51031 RepID=A0ABR1CEW0_NECAM
MTIIGLTETRRRWPLNAGSDNKEKLLLRICDNRGAVEVAALVNTNMAMNINSFEQLTIRIGRVRMRTCESILAVTIFVGHGPRSAYEEVEVFYTDFEKFTKGHSIYKFIVGDSEAKIGP